MSEKEHSTVKQEKSAKSEPLFHITKRADMSLKRSILARLIAILASFTIMSVVLFIMSNENPFVLISSMFGRVFSPEANNIWILFSETAILLGIALALTPAFKMKFWNCGGEGQVMIGSLVAAMTMFFIGDSVSLPVLIALAAVFSILAGGFWGLLPAIFKAKWNVNETLFTLMMNYIAIQFIRFFLKLCGNAQGNLDPMPFAIPTIFGSTYFLNIALILIICIVMYVYLRFSKQGYEISVVGESENTAKYIGINVPKVIIRTMIISGALCGIIGFLLVANGSSTVTDTLADGRGFTAILVSWLGKFNPLYMILTSFLVVFLQRGTTFLGEQYRFDTSMADIFIGAVLLFIIGCEFFINYKINFRKRSKEVTKQ